MSLTIPITLTPVPVPVTVVAADINQLLTVIAQFMQASINEDVSFFQTVAADPTAFTTPIIFNSAQNVFKAWDTSLGRYLPITQFQAGDIKNTFITGDSPQTGWIVCDGRLIVDVVGISQTQQGILNQLFPSGSLPALTPLQAISGLPIANAFSAISIVDTQPPTNQIANLPFSADYNPVESQNFAANAEVLRGSQNDLRTAVVAMRAASQSVLSALSATGVTMVAAVFVGYP